jgi:hypothetical protein
MFFLLWDAVGENERGEMIGVRAYLNTGSVPIEKAQCNTTD